FCHYRRQGPPGPTTMFGKLVLGFFVPPHRVGALPGAGGYSMASRQYCPKCDEPVPVGARECEECGARLMRRDRRDDDEDDRPTPGDRRGPDRPRKKKQKRASRLLIPALAGGGALLLSGVVALIVWAAGWIGGGRGGPGGEPHSERSQPAVNQFEPVAWAIP